MKAKLMKKSKTARVTVSGKAPQSPIPNKESRPRQLKFGRVTVEVAEAPANEQQRNIERGRQALRRASKVLTKVGVQLKHPASIPLYYADPEVPGRLVQVLNGKIRVGVFEAGKFKAVK